MATWRKHPFIQHQKYRIVRDMKTSTSVFHAGEVVEFSDSSHSHYDSSTAFMFFAGQEREIKTWFLHDDDPDEGFRIFEALS